MLMQKQKLMWHYRLLQAERCCPTAAGSRLHLLAVMKYRWKTLARALALVQARDQNPCSSAAQLAAVPAAGAIARRQLHRRAAWSRQKLGRHLLHLHLHLRQHSHHL